MHASTRPVRAFRLPFEPHASEVAGGRVLEVVDVGVDVLVLEIVVVIHVATRWAPPPGTGTN